MHTHTLPFSCNTQDTNTLSHTHIHTCTHTHSHMHTHTYKYTNKHTHTCMHAQTHTCMRAHTHTHTHAHAHTHTLPFILPPFSLKIWNWKSILVRSSLDTDTDCSKSLCHHRKWYVHRWIHPHTIVPEWVWTDALHAGHQQEVLRQVLPQPGSGRWGGETLLQTAGERYYGI